MSRLSSPFLFTLLFVALACAAAPPARAQQGTPGGRTYGEHLTLQLGLLQPLLFRGGNVAASYKRGRWVVDYSHGFALDYNATGAFALTEAQREQDLDIDGSWTTGLGAGYRLTPRLDVRAELKAHRYDVAPPAAGAFAYTTFTAGAGVYYELPVWRRLTLDFSARYWPTVATTLEGGAHRFADPEGRTQVHEAYDLPPFVNVSIGWTL